VSALLRKLFDTLPQFANRDYTQIDGVGVKTIDPFHNLLIGLLGDEFRDNVGVKQVVHRAISARRPLLSCLRSRSTPANGDSWKKSESFFRFRITLRYSA